MYGLSKIERGGSMTLGEKQRRFTFAISELIQYAYMRGYELTMGDGYRDPRLHGEFGEKKSYAAAFSVHKLKLAQDLNLFIKGDLIRDGTHEAWRDLGEQWESYDELARWGGRFKSVDSNHFSFEHQGKM